MSQYIAYTMSQKVGKGDPKVKNLVKIAILTQKATVCTNRGKFGT